MNNKKKEEEEKTCIGVLTTHDDPAINNNLVALFEEFCNGMNIKIIEKFHFVFTGGTFDRIICGKDKAKGIKGVSGHTKSTLLSKCEVTRLPAFGDGGVTILSYLITQRLCSIIWCLFTPKEYHWRRPENLAQFRLCDQWHVKRLINPGSIRKWFYNEAERDAERNKHCPPPKFILREGSPVGEATYIFDKTNVENNKDHYFFEIKKISENIDGKIKSTSLENIIEYVKEQQQPKNFPTKFENMTIALIAHDDMKERMIAFAIDHEWELRKFGSILATGTTGREVAAATSQTIDRKVHRYHSGPKGGDIEIATEILLGRCQIVIFFIDPLHPHPHIDDIRSVFEACMMREGVIMITNEMHARDFMSNVVRARDDFYEPKKR